MLSFCFYVPETHLDIVKDAVFTAGAGVIGAYKHCCWYTRGRAQFLPTTKANPTMGLINQITDIIEVKVEVICSKENIRAVVHAFLQSHPYETPHYTISKVFKAEDFAHEL